MTVLYDSTDMDISSVASNTPNSDVDPECDAGMGIHMLYPFLRAQIFQFLRATFLSFNFPYVIAFQVQLLLNCWI